MKTPFQTSGWVVLSPSAISTVFIVGIIGWSPRSVGWLGI
jgi:hypothetical protein